MRVRILRGANEIGGSCVEIEADHKRIVLDVGKPLWAGWDETVPLPAASGLADGSDPSLLGVVISHPHLDHFGLIDQVDPRVPIYIGREAAELLRAAGFFSAVGVDLKPTAYLMDRSPLQIGPFKITPFLMDHSAFDAYSLLIEGDGHRLFYTGDIRGHGRKARLFERLLSSPPESIDVLLCEGTHVSREVEDLDRARSEADVESSLADRMSETHGAVLVISSAQNIDRLVTVYRAATRSQRTFVTDLYTATLARAIGRPTIPQPGFTRYQVYVPNRQRIAVKRSAEFARMRSIRACRVFPEWLVDHRSEVTLLLSASSVPELLGTGVMRDGSVVWSLWPGYLKDPSGERLQRSLKNAGVPLILDHASGHAPVADLRRLCDALSPGRVVPIHTEAADHYEVYFDHVQRHQDGEWWSI